MIARGIRKEVIIIGTRSELKDYFYNDLKVKSRSKEFLPEVGDNFEFKSFDEQVSKFNDHGMLTYFERQPQEMEKGIKLELKAFYIRVLPDDYYEKLEEERKALT